MFDKHSKDVQAYVAQCTKTKVEEIAEKLILFSRIDTEKVKLCTGISDDRMDQIMTKCEVMASHKFLLEKCSAKVYATAAYHAVRNIPDQAKEFIEDIFEINTKNADEEASVQKWLNDPIKCAIMELTYYDIWLPADVMKILSISRECYQAHYPNMDDRNNYLYICPCREISYEEMLEGYYKYQNYISAYQADVQHEVNEVVAEYASIENVESQADDMAEINISEFSRQLEMKENIGKTCDFAKDQNIIGSYSTLIKLVSDGVITKETAEEYAKVSCREMLKAICEYYTIDTQKKRVMAHD